MECLDSIGTGWTCPAGVTTPSLDNFCAMWTREDDVDHDDYAFSYIYQDPTFGAIECTYPLLSGTQATGTNNYDASVPDSAVLTVDLQTMDICVKLEDMSTQTELDFGVVIASSFTQTFDYDGDCTDATNPTYTWQGSTTSGVFAINQEWQAFGAAVSATYADYAALKDSLSIQYPYDVQLLRDWLDEDRCSPTPSSGVLSYDQCWRRAQRHLTEVVGRNKKLSDGSRLFAKHIWRNMRRVTMIQTDADENGIMDCKEDNIDGNCQAAYTLELYRQLQRKFENLKRFYREKFVF